ncbi:MAG: hypothetical protein A2W36_02900 [Chloroflexi bacterium RBG_16_58_14]|nr:MAG: hypothetical protein A2W36_02900 [Chloroflexi bacterium RBG_16_58_14]
MEKILEQASKHNYLLLILLALGSLAGMAIVLWNYPATPDSLKYFSTPSFPIWLMMMAVFCGLLPVFGIPLWLSLIEFKEHIKKNWLSISVSSVFLYGLFVASIPFAVNVIQIVFPLYKHIDKMWVIFTLGYLAMLPAAIGLWSILSAAKETYERADPDPQKCYPAVQAFNHYRSYLQAYLVIAGILISLVVLSTGAMRQALVEYNPANEQLFSNNMVLAHGLYFTFLLGVLYVPTYIVVQLYGRLLRDKVYPVITLDDYKEKEPLRKQFDEILNLNITVGQNLRAGLFILAPLVTSLFSSLINIRVLG